MPRTQVGRTSSCQSQSQPTGHPGLSELSGNAVLTSGQLPHGWVGKSSLAEPIYANFSVWSHRDEWSSIKNTVIVWSLCENITKILEIKKSPSIHPTPPSPHTHTHTHTHAHRTVGLFTDHYSWQWAASRKCLVENNRTLPLQLKQHPSAIQRVVCVCVHPCPFVCILSAFLFVHVQGNIKKGRKRKRFLSCPFSNVGTGSPSIPLTFTLSFSKLTSPVSNAGLHHFWMRACAGVCVCVWLREGERNREW